MNVLIIASVHVSMYEKCRIAGIVKYIQVNKYTLDSHVPHLRGGEGDV
jgi:hypothetical protein